MSASGFSTGLRRGRTSSATLTLVLGVALGILAAASLVVLHPAPGLRCATLSPIAER